MQVLTINQSSLKLNMEIVQNLLDQLIKRCGRMRTLKNFKKLKKEEITVVLLSSKAMRALNLKYRNKDYATDILSFRGLAPQSLGELILCPSVLKKQALANGHSLDFEIMYMVIHGILHLLGYDHEKSLDQEKKMFALQDRLFRQLTESKINLQLTHVNRRRSQ